MPPPSGAERPGVAAHSADRFSNEIVLQPFMMAWSMSNVTARVTLN
jgi:hypothetical protein